MNGTGPGAGGRPAFDFDPASCTGGHCDRRAQYLQAAVDLLVDDLAEMAAKWAPDGAARQALDDQSAEMGSAAILTGLGSLSYGELAGERIKLGLVLHDPEEEHDCFSDNSHNSHHDNQVGMMALYAGRYVRTDGTLVAGPSMAAYSSSRATKHDRSTPSGRSCSRTGASTTTGTFSPYRPTKAPGGREPSAPCGPSTARYGEP